MSESDRKRWDAKYRDLSSGPSPPLDSMRWIPRAADPRAIALDLACGKGRHVTAIRAQGYRVVAADASIVALRRISSPSGEGRSGLDRVLFDADAWPFGPNAFSLIVQTDFLSRILLDSIKVSVAPDGIVLIDTFAGKGGAGIPGPSNPAFRLRDGELIESFRNWEILEHCVTENREAILAKAVQTQIL